MKKIIALLVSLTTFFSTLCVKAEELNIIVNTVRVNINEGTVTLNDEMVDITTAPYINGNGDTMIEIYPLANALGAEVTNDGEVYTVKFDDVEMVYTLNSDEAIIAGQTIPMPSAVESNNGSVVVPLRFVSEALGADVTYDGELGEIVIVSMGEMDEGVNYKLLFRYSEKNKIGNSKEHWRFTKTDNFDMADFYDDGYYEFAMDDIMISMSCEKNTDENNLNVYYAAMQTMDSEYNRVVMFDKFKGDQNGVPYVCIKYRTLDTISEYYGYETEEYMYYIMIERYFDNFAASKENPDVDAFIKSLEFNYNGGDEENTVDLANINSAELLDEDKTEYVDGNYRWSIKLYGEWAVEEYYGFYNKVVIKMPSGVEKEEMDDYYMYDYYEPYDPTIVITSYSSLPGKTSEAWAKEKHNVYKNTVNTEIYSISDVNSVNIGNYQAKCFEVKYKDGENEFVEKYYYIDDGKYRYEICLDYDKREEENSGFLNNATAIIQSFTPGDVNKDEVGETLEPDNVIELMKIYTQYEGDFVTLSYPCSWNVNETKSGVSISAEYDYYGMTSLFGGAGNISARITKETLRHYEDDLSMTYYTPEEYMKKNLADVLNLSDSSVDVSLVGGVEEVDISGKKGYSAEIKVIMEDDSMYCTVYVVPYDEENVIMVMKMCEDDSINTVYETALDSIISSLKFS